MQKLLSMIKPVKTKKDYDAALIRCYILMQKKLKPRTSETDELEILSILVENYEQKHFSIPAPNPIDAIKYRIQQTGMDEKELTKILGGSSRKSEILSGKRKLSLNMIRELPDKFNIPAETLIAEY